MQLKEKFPGIFVKGREIYTENLVKGFRYSDEKIIKIKGVEYREFNPFRSKLAAAVAKGFEHLPFPEKRDWIMLYLGAAHGYTVSYVSDILCNGFIYAVEFSDRCFKELLPVCKERKNIAPIFADARKPEEYSWIEEVHALYVDIAQPDATEIAMRNADEFLKQNGILFLAIKTRSIDVTQKPKKICQAEVEKLSQAGWKILEWRMLDPFEKDHGFIIAKK
ncbi:MAG TPA: fibrillarin-like rRNA/tRNA 2'-O-methyltransferase [Nanoarchaeota archaeon]|nr:fibrillarin-like rRNA/tRNA 2'-O-methyltransferase [Nanoarchaeota archaeon]